MTLGETNFFGFAGSALRATVFFAASFFATLDLTGDLVGAVGLRFAATTFFVAFGVGLATFLVEAGFAAFLTGLAATARLALGRTSFARRLRPLADVFVDVRLPFAGDRLNPFVI